MYCINCGVKLGEGETKCPLCLTPVCHPDFPLGERASKKSFPEYTEVKKEEFNKSGILFILTFLFIIPFMLTLLVDLRLNQEITWSGYAASGILFCYVITVLPIWFRTPRPEVFIPVDFLAAALFLLYINYETGGGWFLPLALPITVQVALVVIPVTVLSVYLKQGYLYIFGGAFILMGIFTVFTEYLINKAFSLTHGLVWSIYPLVVFVLLGILLIIIAICRPLRESLSKKFFI